MPLIDSYTKLLLHMNGADGSTSFIDATGKTITKYGNAQIDTAQYKFGGASGLFDGVNSYLGAPDSADWRLDGGSNSNQWTIDFWARFNGAPGSTRMGFIQQYVDADNRWNLYFTASGNLGFAQRLGGVTNIDIENAWVPSGSVWYHVACVKQGTTGYKMFINGTQIGSTQTNTTALADLAGSLRVGMAFSNSLDNYFKGWLDEVRISKGIARWTSNFTPPKYPYGAYGQVIIL